MLDHSSSLHTKRNISSFLLFFSQKQKKKAKGCIFCQLFQWHLMKSVRLFSSKWGQNLNRNQFSYTWEYFSLFLLLSPGEMSVFTRFFQFPACTCWFQFNFPWQLRGFFSFWRPKWSWNRHMPGLCYIRRGCSKLESCEDPLPGHLCHSHL